MASSPLFNKLLDFAMATEVGDLILADTILNDLLTANETEEATTKLVKYFAEALVRRVYKLYPRNPRPLVPSCTDLRRNIDYQFLPFFWFAELATRNFIVDSLTGKQRVHFIDFSIMKSGQRWGWLLEELDRKQLNGRMSFCLTTVGPMLSKKVDYLQDILDKLPREVEKFPNIDFEVRHLVANRPADIVESVCKLRRISEDETIIVKWEFELHKLLAVPGATEKVLSKLMELRPESMIVVEQEANHIGPNLLDWFSESFRYYSVVFNSLNKDDFKCANPCKVLWEMYFRRQICKLVAQEGTDQVERHETFAQWRDRLCFSGFHHVRLWLNQYKRGFFDHFPGYSMEEKDRHPVLCREDYTLVVASIWKPGPTQLNAGSLENWNPESIHVGDNLIQDGHSCPLIGESESVNNSEFHEDQPDDSDIMLAGNAWSAECFSINKLAASAEIFDMLEYVCHVHYLPLALTWISDSREGNTNSTGKHILRVENSACYLNDFTMKGFFEACEKHHLEEGQGVAGKALQSNTSLYFVSDISKLGVNDYPFIFYAWEFGLQAAVAIKLTSIYMSNFDYIVEFFLPPEMKEISAQHLLIDGIKSILQQNTRSSWMVCSVGANISSDLMIKEVGMFNSRPSAISNSPPPELSEIGSLNSSQIRELSNIFRPTIDGVELPQAHEQEVEEQNSTFGPAAPGCDTEVIGIDSTPHLNTGTNKRRRTSEVWQYFDEVRGNGEVWAICKSCSTKYRGESTRGTTNLHKHLKSCSGKR